MGDLLARYLKTLLGYGEPPDPDMVAYRGQRDVGWSLQSSAYRRLERSLGATGGVVTEEQQIEYNNDLVAGFRHKRFDREELTDLEVLGQLQHLGAATSLIDFSRNPLVALWFACEDTPTDQTTEASSQRDGAVFIVDTSVPAAIDLSSEIDVLLRQLHSPFNVLAWDPPPVASVRDRVAAQHSVLLLGRSLMSPNPTDQKIKKVTVNGADKDGLRRELAAVGISSSTLFPDRHGFAATNGVAHPVTRRSAADHRELGISEYQRGNEDRARQHLTRYVHQAPDDWMTQLLISNVLVDLQMYDDAVRVMNAAEPHLDSISWVSADSFYANRGNTKAAMGDHSGAVDDYTRSLRSKDRSIEDILRFNRGNSYFALREFDSALADFEACSWRGAASHNAGNACVVLGELGVAAQKFAEAQGTAAGDSPSRRSFATVNEIMSVVGSDQCVVEVREAYGPVSPDPGYGLSLNLRLVIRSDRVTGPRRDFSLAGNFGNTGNFGWSNVGEPWSTGSQGFEGLNGMAVEVWNDD